MHTQTREICPFLSRAAAPRASLRCAPSPCPGCSMLVDELPRMEHLNARDTTLVVVAAAPLAQIGDAGNFALRDPDLDVPGALVHQADHLGAGEGVDDQQRRLVEIGR